MSAAVLHTIEVGESPLNAIKASIAEQAAAFAEEGALELTVHHPAMDVSGAQLLEFRVGDLLVHSWDLAQSIGVDETLDADVVAVEWQNLQPMLPFIGTIGIFGEGPSGSVADDAPLQTRLLDAMGRRP